MMRETNPIMRAAARSALNDAIDSLLASGMRPTDVEDELESSLDAAMERGHYGAAVEEYQPQTSGELFEADDEGPALRAFRLAVGPPVPGGVEAGRLESAQLAVGRWVAENSEDLLGLLERDPDDLDSAEGLANPAELAAELRDVLAEWDTAGDFPRGVRRCAARRCVGCRVIRDLFELDTVERRIFVALTVAFLGASCLLSAIG